MGEGTRGGEDGEGGLVVGGKLHVDSVNFFCNFCEGGNNILFKSLSCPYRVH